MEEPGECQLMEPCLVFASVLLSWGIPIMLGLLLAVTQQWGAVAVVLWFMLGAIFLWELKNAFRRVQLATVQEKTGSSLEEPNPLRQEWSEGEVERCSLYGLLVGFLAFWGGLFLMLSNGDRQQEIKDEGDNFRDMFAFIGYITAMLGLSCICIPLVDLFRRLFWKIIRELTKENVGAGGPTNPSVAGDYLVLQMVSEESSEESSEEFLQTDSEEESGTRVIKITLSLRRNECWRWRTPN